MGKQDLYSYKRAFYNPQGGLYCWPIDEIKSYISKTPYERVLPSGKTCRGEVIDYFFSVKWKNEATAEEFSIYNKEEYDCISSTIERYNSLAIRLNNILSNQYFTFFYSGNFYIITDESCLTFSKLQLLADSGIYAILFNDAIMSGEEGNRFFLIFDKIMFDCETIHTFKSIIRNYLDDKMSGKTSHVSGYCSVVSDIVKEIDSRL